MKRYLSLLIVFAAFLGLFSCREQEMGSIVVEKMDFVFGYEPSEQSCNVTGAYDVRVSSDKGWCAASLSGDSKKTLRVWVLANPDEASREASLTLSASGCESVVLKVTQKGMTESDRPYLFAEVHNLEVKSDASDVSVPIFTNQDVVDIISHPEWCDAEVKSEKESKLLELSFKTNTLSSDRSGKVVLTAAGCDNLELELLQQGVKSADCELFSLELKASQNQLKSDVKFTLDKNTNTLTAKYLKWIEKDEPEMLVPTFTMNGHKAMIAGQDVVSGKTAVSFADDFDLVIVAENGDTHSYRVSLNCPQINRELPVLYMRPDRIIDSKDVYVDTYVDLYDKTTGSTGEGWWDSAEKGKIQVRGRGNSTWGLPKKPYRLKFTEDFSPVGLNHACEKSWVLMAQDMDKSLIRNLIAFEYSRILFNSKENYHDEKALNFTPCSKLVNVYFTGNYYYFDTHQTKHLDGEYLGVFQLSDQMQRKKGRIEVEKLKKADGNDPAKITGGYIIEADIHEGNHYSPRKGVKFTYKYPEDDDYDPAQYDYITNFIGAAENALYSSNFKNPETGWRKWFDEKTLADYIIVKELAQDMDGYTSTYLYKRRGVDKLFFGPIWDCDKGWDNERRVPHGEYPPMSSLMIHGGFWMNAGMYDDWFQHFWRDETFRAFVAKRWASKKNELLAATDRILDTIPVEAAKAIDANFTVWKFNYQYSNEAKLPAKTYPEEIERIRKLTYQRAALLDRLFNQ